MIPKTERLQNYKKLHVVSYGLECGLKAVQYSVSNGFDTAYREFLRVGTTFDIFQNIHILYLKYGVLVFWIRRIDLVSFVVFASNLRRIQVKDIAKEVKDHLKTYSSAGMDISWYVEGIRNSITHKGGIKDYTGCNLDRKSTSRGCQILGRKLVCWSAKKQSYVAMSSVEAEYHFIKYHMLKGDIELHFVPTDLQLAYTFTKPLAEPSFTRLVAELVALLEHPNVLYHPMLRFLSNCCISTTLTRQPSATYVEYLKEFWYTAEVDEATKTITFSLSLVEKPLSFTQEKFMSTTGLPICENVVPTPPKETVRAGLATLGLFDKDKPSLSSSVLVNSSPIKIKYFTPIWRLFMQYIVKCLGGMQGSHDQLNLNQQTIAYSLIWGLEIDIRGIIFSDLIYKI
ncbi:hypothetical protein Tco_1080541 [Tanacetum coccineum]|uniref:Uncharacterized protein n=1 Tax=Tanacetum coccineum TaxID=301880 RepID=A0ABQ5HV26_9ASTR